MDHKEAAKLARLENRARQQGGVGAPRFGGYCWAEVRAYTGSAFPGFVPCAKPARPGLRTCHWHRDREMAAQQLDKGEA